MHRAMAAIMESDMVTSMSLFNNDEPFHSLMARSMVNVVKDWHSKETASSRLCLAMRSLRMKVQQRRRIDLHRSPQG